MNLYFQHIYIFNYDNLHIFHEIEYIISGVCASYELKLHKLDINQIKYA